MAYRLLYYWNNIVKSNVKEKGKKKEKLKAMWKLRVLLQHGHWRLHRTSG